MSKRKYLEIIDKKNNFYQLKNKINLDSFELSYIELLKLMEKKFYTISIDSQFQEIYPDDPIITKFNN